MDIDVENKTTLTGAVIASDTGDLTLDTGSFEYSHIKDKEKSYNVGGGASYGTSNRSANSDYGFTDSRQTNFATIGEGTIIIRDTSASLGAGGSTNLSGLNRDVSKAQYSTKEGGLQGGFTVDSTTVNFVTTNPVDTFKETKDKVLDGLKDAKDTSVMIYNEAGVAVEKAGNLVSYGAFGLDTDRNVVTAKLTDQMSDAGINLNGVDPVGKIGQKVMGNDGTVYVVGANGLTMYGRVEDYTPGEPGGTVDSNAYGKYLEDKIYNTWKDGTPLILNAQIAELEQINPEAAREIKTAFADIRVKELIALGQNESIGQDYDSLIKGMIVDPSKISQREQELRDTQVYLDNPVEIKPTVNYHTTVVPICDIISTGALESTVTFLGGSLGKEIQVNEYKHYSIEIDNNELLNSSLSVETTYFAAGVDKNELNGIGATASYSAGLSYGRFGSTQEGIKTFIGGGKELNVLNFNLGQSDRNENGNRWTNASVSGGMGIIFNAGNTNTVIQEKLISETQKTTFKLEQ